MYADRMARGSGIKEQDALSPEAVLYGRLLPGSPQPAGNSDEQSPAHLGQNQLRVLKALNSYSGEYGSALDIDIHQLVERSGIRALSHIGGVLTVLNSLKKHDLVTSNDREWQITELGKKTLDTHSL